MVELDSESLFNATAAVVATVAAVIFINNVGYPYSPVSKVGLVLLFMAAIFAITQTTDDRQLTLLGYGVVVVAGVALFFDLVGTFEAGQTVTVVGLLLIAAGLFSLRRFLDDRNRFVSAERAKAGLAALAVVVALVLVVDVATGGLAYELQVQQSVEFDGGERKDQVRVATVVVSNPTPFPERVERPRYGACAAGNWSEFRPEDDGERRRVHTDVSVRNMYGDHVFSFGQSSYPVVLYLNAEGIRGESFPVELRERCPNDETGSPYIALFRVPDRQRYGYPG